MGGGLRQHLTRRTLIAGICAGLFLCFFALPMVAGAQAGEAAQLDLGVIEGTIYKLTTAIGGMFLWLGGSLLDIAIRQLVVGMGYWLNSSPMGATIDALWMVIRDIFNILFIFGLIYTGFKTILGLSGANTQKAVAMLIVAALFINFSLYFTKAIIDFSNVAAYQIYRMIDVHPEEAANGEVGGVTDAFLMYYGLTSYADPNAELLNQMSEESGWAPSGRVIAYAFMMMLFMLLAAFVFLASAILLITRFVALIIFMIFSPLMFLGLILPDFQQYMKKWWHSFLNYAFVAPAFLFMIYLSLRVLQGYNTQFGGGSFAQAFQADSGPTGMFSIFLNFFVITAFLWGSLLVAQKMGVAGASQMVKFGEGVTKNVRGGIQGFAGRNTIGRLGDAAQKYYDRKDAADGRTVRVLRSLGLDRSIRNVTEKGKNAKFGSSE